MKNINEYLLGKNKKEIGYEVPKGDETFDVMLDRGNANKWIIEFTNWFFPALKNSGILTKEEYEEFKNREKMSWYTSDTRLTDIKDDKINKFIVTNIKPSQYTYRDIFEIIVNFYELNKKNIKIV